MPESYNSKPDRQPIDDGLNHSQRLRDQQYPAPIETIRNGTAERADK
jgi:hypothetical protein